MSQNDQALITLTGFDVKSFHFLLIKFAPTFDGWTPHVDTTITQITTTRGRRRMIRPEDCLGLLLAWSRTRGSMMVLQLIFGMTMTNLSVYLRFARRIIIKVLRNDPMAAIRLPSSDKIEVYKHAIQERHQRLENVWCTIDGLKLKLQQAPGQCIQE